MEKTVLFEQPKERSLDFASMLQIFVFVDLLFLPRLLFAFGIPVSLLFVVFSLAKVNLRWPRLLCALLLLATMIVSVLYGTYSGKNVVPEESLKRALQLFAILLYSFLPINVGIVRPALVKVLRAFYIWIFLAMLMFFFQPGLYGEIVARVYPETLDMLESTLEIFRFAYLYSDPNSAGYLICLTLVGYLFMEDEFRWAVACTTLAVLVILATQSRGAYIGVVLILLYFGLASKAALSKKLLVLAGCVVALAGVAASYSENVELAYSVFESRFDQEEDLGGGRSGKYQYMIENFNLHPYGTGYHLRRDGDEFRPHSDFIRVNLSYGILAFPLLMYFIFPRRRRQVLLFAVFLIPFLINTVIDDFRLFGLYLLLFATLAQNGAAIPPSGQTSSARLARNERHLDHE